MHFAENDAVRYTDADYPATLITVFGGSTPAGKLPVDLPAYTEGVGYTDEIVFPVRCGLTF